MSYPQFDRFKVKMKSLKERMNKKNIECDRILPTDSYKELTNYGKMVIAELVKRVKQAKDNNRPIMLTFGAHTIKNGLSPVLIKLIEEKWITHLATNGAGIIHDWEFAFQGMTSENVKTGVDKGEFGNWQETGYYINLAINVGAYEGKGYGESVGSMIYDEGLIIPSEEQLLKEIKESRRDAMHCVSTAADLLWIIRKFGLKAGNLKIPHPYKEYSAQAQAYKLGIPFTGHPMIGHDIIYNHPMNQGASIGRVAERDFLTFAESVSRLDGGVYISVGSAVMSPMVFEKSLSISQNIAIQQGKHIDNHYMLIVDLAESHWDWQKGEPPEDNPDYYLRYCKSFSRMGGIMRYLTLDNRDFLLALYQNLSK